MAELGHHPADLGTTGEGLELADQRGPFGPLPQSGEGRDDVFGHTKRGLRGKAGRGERAERGGERGSQGIEQGTDRGLAHALAPRPVVGRGPDRSEIGMIDIRDHDQGGRGLALGMFDEVMVPCLGERHVRGLQPLAAVDDQQQQVTVDGGCDGRLPRRSVAARLLLRDGRIAGDLDPAHCSSVARPGTGRCPGLRAWP